MKRGLPVGPPPEELMDLPLDPTADESPFLRPRRRTRLKPRRRGLAARALLIVQIAAVALVGVVCAWTAWQRVFASDKLRVGKLEVRGSHFLSEGEVLLFGDAPYKSRLVTFLSLRRELAQKAPDAEHFDLRFRGRIFAKHRQAPAAASEPGAPPSRPAAENSTVGPRRTTGPPSTTPPAAAVAAAASLTPAGARPVPLRGSASQER